MSCPHSILKCERNIIPSQQDMGKERDACHVPTTCVKQESRSCPHKVWGHERERLLSPHKVWLSRDKFHVPTTEMRPCPHKFWGYEREKVPTRHGKGEGFMSCPHNIGQG